MGGPGGAAFASAAHFNCSSVECRCQIASASRSFCRMLPAVLFIAQPVSRISFECAFFNVSNTEIRQALSWRRAVIGLAQIARQTDAT